MWYDEKYGIVTVQNPPIAAELDSGVEPVFVLRAQDISAVDILKTYAAFNPHLGHKIIPLIAQFETWQLIHPTKSAD